MSNVFHRPGSFSYFQGSIVHRSSQKWPMIANEQLGTSFVQSLLDDSTILHRTTIAFPEVVIFGMMAHSNELFNVGPWVNVKLESHPSNSHELNSIFCIECKIIPLVQWFRFTLTKTGMRTVLFKIQIWHLHIKFCSNFEFYSPFCHFKFRHFRHSTFVTKTTFG